VRAPEPLRRAREKSRNRPIASTQRMSSGLLRSRVISMYSTSTAAMPDTMPENKKTMGISGVDHQGFAFTEPGPYRRDDWTLSVRARRGAHR
jgi:hypothetical protein